MDKQCQNCQHFQGGISECWRYPQRQSKKADQWCGEFLDKEIKVGSAKKRK